MHHRMHVSGHVCVHLLIDLCCRMYAVCMLLHQLLWMPSTLMQPSANMPLCHQGIPVTGDQMHLVTVQMSSAKLQRCFDRCWMCHPL